MWGVVEVRSNKEALAERSLREIGYDPLVVRYIKLIRGARIAPDGRRIRSRKDELQARPFIPGYLFLPLEVDDDATLVDVQRGVKRLFRSRDADGYPAKPKLIRARIVEQIKIAAAERDETPRPVRSDLKPGDRVRIPGGIEAVLLKLDEKGRAEYMAEILGGQVPGSIKDANLLELVAS